jgi:triosephosphate isomerase
MYKDYKISPPFFEIGPKAYLYGERMLALAKVIDRTAMKYDLDVIVTPQYTDIRLLAENTERIHVYAQHMDYLPVGRGLGSVLPEAVKAAGAVGVMLNHAEKKLTLDAVAKTIARADEVGLATIVCADSVEELEACARLSPNLLVAEPTELIGTGETAGENYVRATIRAVHEINPDIMVLQGAGISNGRDVYDTIRLGAMATGSTSGIMKAADPYAMVEEMLYNLRRAWDEMHPGGAA